MSLYSDLNEVLTPYAQRIKNLRADSDELQDIIGYTTESETPDIATILGTETYPSGWRNGSFDSSTGAPTNSSRYIRTLTGGENEVVAPENVSKIRAKAPTGRYISVYEYNSSGTYIGRYGVPNNISDTGTQEVETDATAGYIYKFCIGMTAGASEPVTDWLTEEFINQIEIEFIMAGRIPTYSIREQISGLSTGMESVLESVENIPSAFLFSANDFSNFTILCAKERNYTDRTPTSIDWYLLCDTENVIYITKDFRTGKKIIVTDFDPLLWKWGIMPNGDIISVYRTEFHSDGASEDYRMNPYVYLASEGWKIKHTVDFGTALKPSGWLENCGFCSMPTGEAMFGEYTRPSVITVNCWKISGDITDPASWTVVKSFNQSGSATSGLEHIHYVMYDFYTGIYYISTGDDDIGSQLWYSTDDGDTWSLAREPSEKYCRSLNLVFTEDYIWWASDSSAAVNHFLFRCERNASGVIDFSTITEVMSVYVRGVATYGLSYLPMLNALVLLDKCDTAGTEMPFRIYCIDDGQLYTMGTLETADGNEQTMGFRTEYSEWYPNGNYILCSFGKRLRLGDYKNYIKGAGNAGNYNGYAENVNNLRISIFKKANGYGFAIRTAFSV